MSLFEKIEELKKLNIRERQLEIELKDLIIRKFLRVAYKMELLELIRDDGSKVKVYYPVLDLPAGYVKKEEKLFWSPILEHGMACTYILSNMQGKEIKIHETAYFTNSFYDGKIKSDFNMINKDVKYHIAIQEKEYQFERSFDCIELLDQVLENKLLNEYTYYSEEIYNQNETLYKEYIKVLGKEDDIDSLKEIAKTDKKELEISGNLLAKIRVTKTPIELTVWRKNSQVMVNIGNKPGYYVVIELRLVTSNGGMELNKKVFAYNELENEQQYAEPMNLYDAIK